MDNFLTDFLVGHNIVLFATIYDKNAYENIPQEYFMASASYVKRSINFYLLFKFQNTYFVI